MAHHNLFVALFLWVAKSVCSVVVESKAEETCNAADGEMESNANAKIETYFGSGGKGGLLSHNVFALEDLFAEGKRARDPKYKWMYDDVGVGPTGGLAYYNPHRWSGELSYQEFRNEMQDRPRLAHDRPVRVAITGETQLGTAESRQARELVLADETAVKGFFDKEGKEGSFGTLRDELSGHMRRTKAELHKTKWKMVDIALLPDYCFISCVPTWLKVYWSLSSSASTLESLTQEYVGTAGSLPDEKLGMQMFESRDPPLKNQWDDMQAHIFFTFTAAIDANPFLRGMVAQDILITDGMAFGLDERVIWCDYRWNFERMKKEKGYEFTANSRAVSFWDTWLSLESPQDMSWSTLYACGPNPESAKPAKPPSTDDARVNANVLYVMKRQSGETTPEEDRRWQEKWVGVETINARCLHEVTDDSNVFESRIQRYRWVQLDHGVLTYGPAGGCRSYRAWDLVEGAKQKQWFFPLTLASDITADDDIDGTCLQISSSVRPLRFCFDDEAGMLSKREARDKWLEVLKQHWSVFAGARDRADLHKKLITAKLQASSDDAFDGEAIKAKAAQDFFTKQDNLESEVDAELARDEAVEGDNGTILPAALVQAGQDEANTSESSAELVAQRARFAAAVDSYGQGHLLLSKINNGLGRREDAHEAARLLRHGVDEVLQLELDGFSMGSGGDDAMAILVAIELAKLLAAFVSWMCAFGAAWCVLGVVIAAVVWVAYSFSG